MIRQTEHICISKKCKENTIYILNQHGTAKVFPYCMYYDWNNNKCELNGCIKNFYKRIYFPLGN